MKKNIEKLIYFWAIYMADAGALQLQPAIESILKSIESELQKYKLKLIEKEDEFQAFIHAALNKIQSLPQALRIETFSYLNGGIQREVQRPEYQRLKQCFIPYLKPIPWSRYFVFIATEVLPASLFILIIVSLPGLALAARKTNRLSSENTALECRHNLKIDHRQNSVMFTHVKRQLTKMGVDYGALFNQADFSLEATRYHADCLAYNLTQFGTGRLTLTEETEWLTSIANDVTFMEPLHQILLYAQNKSLVYKIIAKLSQMLYEDIQSSKALNANKLMNILGRAIMIIQPDALPANVTTGEINRMMDILLLYRSIAEDISAVNQQYALLQAERRPVSSPTPETTYSYYNLILAVLTGIGLVQLFMWFLNRASVTVETSPLITTKSKEIKNVAKEIYPIFQRKPSTKDSSHMRSYIQKPIVEKAAAPKSLNAILAKLNDLFLDIIIPEPLYWHGNANECAILQLESAKYCFDTRGDGKSFWLSKTALSILLLNYCKDYLGAKGEFIHYNDEYLCVEQPLTLQFAENIRPVKQSYATFLKPLKKIANLYYPMDIQLDYHNENFIVTFHLTEESYDRITPYYLTEKDFINCVRNSMHLKNGKGAFSIPLKTIQHIALPNEKEFLKIKEIACIEKTSELNVSPTFFYPSTKRYSDARMNRTAISKQSNSL